MTRPIRPSDIQNNNLTAVCAIARQRTGKRVQTTLDILRDAGYTPMWQRVVWTGGVGSYRWMPRRKRYRILVAATKSGLTKSTVKQFYIVPGIVDTRIVPGKRRGYRYGWCVEC